MLFCPKSVPEKNDYLCIKCNAMKPESMMSQNELIGPNVCVFCGLLICNENIQKFETNIRRKNAMRGIGPA